MQQVAKMDDMQKIDHLTKRSSELLADMRRLEKENQKNKKRGDTLQKERDTGRTELAKTVGLKDKLEKLCRELQRDNNKMKVGRNCTCIGLGGMLTQRSKYRMKTRSYKRHRSKTVCLGTRNTLLCCPSWRAIRKRKTRLESRWWTSRSMSCECMTQETTRSLLDRGPSTYTAYSQASGSDSNHSLNNTSCGSSIFIP